MGTIQNDECKLQLDKKHHSMIKGYANNEIRGTIEGEGFVVGGGGEDPCHESLFVCFTISTR